MLSCLRARLAVMPTASTTTATRAARAAAMIRIRCTAGSPVWPSFSARHYSRTMFEMARTPLKAALIAAFTVGLVLFLLDPPSLSGCPAWPCGSAAASP